jgi:hypothetical protein
MSASRPQISEKQLYEAEKTFKMYEAMINAMEEEVGLIGGLRGVTLLLIIHWDDK